ncbi:hypothetical protein CK203_063633 [Vitis vinifera]|uniref:Retrotransposon gag domain-containing protein n=1 Tax=Vitis vinifera TaxID=29760 RepID=A0A438G4S6_VITVI|nr:hypothetical protein CK203_063633 [Vitis vinifera]
MATPSRSRSSGRGEEDNSEWRRAIERRQLARTTTESSPPGDRKIKRRKRGTTHPGFNIGASSSSAFKRPERVPHRDPMVTPMVRNVHSHLAARQDGRNLPNEPPIGSISKRLDDMLSTPFCSHIIHYEPPRGFLVPKFSTYDGDLSEAFVGQYLCSARHKQNISTLQNIKMQDNESLREFVKRFGQAVLQVEAYSMDAVLQIFNEASVQAPHFSNR